MKFINKFFQPLMLERTLVPQAVEKTIPTAGALKLFKNHNKYHLQPTQNSSEYLDRNCKKLICAIIYRAYIDLLRYYANEVDAEMRQFGNPESFFFDDLNEDGSYKPFQFSHYCYLLNRENDIYKVKAYLVKLKNNHIMNSEAKSTSKRFRACKARYSNW